ncbi:MAG: HEPN domain-containing protein [Chloroflexi bacterium]|nr:HEPN domain-containing protein [Chloroflexota bacterium]
MLKDLKTQIPKINEQKRVSLDVIQNVVDHIVQTFDPEKIILFGSYAYGEPKPWSDVDLLVVMETDRPRQKQKEINQSLLPPFSLDILVWTPQEIAQRIPLGDFFLREIVTKGKILYEREKTPLQWSEIMEDPQTGPNSYVLEWVQKAEGDFEAASKLLSLQLENLSDPVCFHCQQCAEKYAKAYLIHNTIEFPWTHDLLELQARCQKQDATFATILPQMGLLNNYSVHIRYPGRFTSLEEAEGASEAMNTIRTFFRSKLGLS